MMSWWSHDADDADIVERIARKNALITDRQPIKYVSK